MAGESCEGFAIQKYDRRWGTREPSAYQGLRGDVPSLEISTSRAIPRKGRGPGDEGPTAGPRPSPPAPFADGERRAGYCLMTQTLISGFTSACSLIGTR